jgi:ribosome biogenesis protein BRX1
MFGTPKGHPKSKPFIDHVLGFYIVDNAIWFRNYQVKKKKSTLNPSSLTPLFPLAQTDR